MIVCGLALAGVAALGMVRLAGLDAGTFLAVPVAGLPFAAVGTVVLLCVSLGLRSRALALAAAVLLVAQFAWLVPRFVPDATDVPADAPRLRVGTSNAFVGRVDARALVEFARSQRLDVLAVQELTHGGVRALDEAGMAELMPYRELHPEVDSSIYARRPLSGGGLLDRPTTWPQAVAEIAVGGRAVRVVAVHTYYPAGDPDRWERDLAALRAEAGRDVILLGDFNATLDHAPLRDLLDAGLTDSHAELGRGWAPTWPAGRDIVPPLIQLDHVLHGAGLAAVSASEHALPGTDHHAVVAELALLDHPRWPAGRDIVPPLIQLDHVLHGAGLAAVSASEHALPGTDHHAVVAELALLDHPRPS
ncbi:endonuclease/exonuclease/phosphatase family protein [Qaidamihabitans albus]|uniref:endonuclease/exonuclease/phosphatase family protein n=1 Tax=Qaidamihabitans albus TaxID=2795733 RepID=UPI003FD73C04